MNLFKKACYFYGGFIFGAEMLTDISSFEFGVYFISITALLVLFMPNVQHFIDNIDIQIVEES